MAVKTGQKKSKTPVQSAVVQNVPFLEVADAPVVKKKTPVKKVDVKPEETTKRPASEARKNAEDLYKALSKIFETDKPENTSPAKKKSTIDAVRSVTKTFQTYTHTDEKIVFHNERGNISVEPKVITFKSAPVEAGQEPAKSAFDKNSALAMARLASQNPRMIERGVKIGGTKEHQDLLRAAIREVNETLPEGQKLKIAEDKTVSPMSAFARGADKPSPEKVAPQKTVRVPVEHKAVANGDVKKSVPSVPKAKATPVAEKAPEAPVAAPEKKKEGFKILDFLSFRRTKKADVAPVKETKPVQAAPVQEKPAQKSAVSVMSRRALLTGGLALGGVAMLPDTAKAGERKHKTLWEILFPRNEKHNEQKQKAGKIPTPEKKPKRETKAEKKRRLKREQQAQRQKPKKETRAEKAERIKEEARKQKPETRKEKAQRLKKEKQEAAKGENNQKPKKNEKAAHGSVRIVCTHTGASTTLNFNSPRSCQRDFNQVTKDWRKGVTCNMAPGLITLLGRVTNDLRGRGHDVSEIHIVAGFRTEETNNMLIEASKKRNGGKSGVAQNSFHKKGMALDFYISGVSMAQLRNSAKRAGAWSYSAGDFVHMDTRGAYTV